jgi:hypothetical protein
VLGWSPPALGPGLSHLLCCAVLAAAAAQSGEQGLTYGAFGFKISERNWRVNATRKQKKEGLKVRVCVSQGPLSLISPSHNSKSKQLRKRTLSNTAMHIVFALLVKSSILLGQTFQESV